jgi:hypothetical protein
VIKRVLDKIEVFVAIHLGKICLLLIVLLIWLI